MKTHLLQNATFSLCILILAFAPWAQSQEQTNPAPQVGAKLGKKQPKEEEPEANANSGTEVLQKATQNPVDGDVTLIVGVGGLVCWLCSSALDRAIAPTEITTHRNGRRSFIELSDVFKTNNYSRAPFPHKRLTFSGLM